MEELMDEHMEEMEELIDDHHDGEDVEEYPHE